MFGVDVVFVVPESFVRKTFFEGVVVSPSYGFGVVVRGFDVDISRIFLKNPVFAAADLNWMTPMRVGSVNVKTFSICFVSACCVNMSLVNVITAAASESVAKPWRIT